MVAVTRRGLALGAAARARGGLLPLLNTLVLLVNCIVLVRVMRHSPATTQACPEPRPEPAALQAAPEQQAAGAAAAAAAAADGTAVLLPPINLIEMLQPINAMASVSEVAYMNFRCVPSLKDSLHGRTDAVLKERHDALLHELSDIVGRVKGGPVNASLTLLESLGLGSTAVAHPQFLEAREQISEHLGRYALNPEGTAMCCEKEGQLVASEELGKLGGPDGCGVECVGYLHASELLGLTIAEIVKSTVYDDMGWCTDPPDYPKGYASEMVRRMNNPQYLHWFNVATYADDSVLFAFQLLYEHHKVFLRQRWLGAVLMQNPFDALAIQNIIADVKPDLIVETGTAKGGSALMWASVLHLLGQGGRVITIDITSPQERQLDSFGKNNVEPWESPVWKEHVTFIKGSSLDPDVAGQVKAARAEADRVLVLLDSSHAEDFVEKEAKLYCPLATVGSYCIIQDTKMGRFGWQGPMRGLEAFIGEHPEFESDRSRELMFTDHPRGYLRRLRV